MTLQEVITKITEAEASISKEMENDNLDLAQDYVNYTHTLLEELVNLMPTLSEEDRIEAREFSQAYSEHIKSQLKVLSDEKQHVEQEYRQFKQKHNVSNRYAKIKKMMASF